jgi:hypothetical protein
MHMRELYDNKSEFSYLQVLEVHKTSTPKTRRCKLFYVSFSPHQYTKIQDFRAILSISSTEVLTKTKLRGLSPRANYIDRAAAAGRRS